MTHFPEHLEAATGPGGQLPPRRRCPAEIACDAGNGYHQCCRDVDHPGRHLVKELTWEDPAAVLVLP